LPGSRRIRDLGPQALADQASQKITLRVLVGGCSLSCRMQLTRVVLAENFRLRTHEVPQPEQEKSFEPMTVTCTPSGSPYLLLEKLAYVGVQLSA
jgi:hypothetical protein